jgi:hypothetical protein
MSDFIDLFRDCIWGMLVERRGRLTLWTRAGSDARKTVVQSTGAQRKLQCCQQYSLFFGPRFGE